MSDLALSTMAARSGSERRLSAPERRAQLVEVAYSTLRANPYASLTHEDLAARVGVSKPLVFHYFPTVTDLRLAVFERLAGDLLHRLNQVGELPLGPRLRAGIEAFIDTADHHTDLYLHLVRGAAGDERLHDAMQATRDGMARLVGAWAGIESPSPAVLVIIRGYLGLVEEAVLQWLPTHPLPRSVLVDFLSGALGEMPNQASRLLDPPDRSTSAPPEG